MLKLRKLFREPVSQHCSDERISSSVSPRNYSQLKNLYKGFNGKMFAEKKI